MIYLANAFSLNMLAKQQRLYARPLTIHETRDYLASGFLSAVGHQDTANVLEGMLELPIPANRINVTLQEGDKVVVAQYVGPRLSEGATKLPEGARIEFWLVEVS